MSPVRKVLSAGAVAAIAAGGSIAVALEANAAAGCRVDYAVTNQWQGGFGAAVSVTNLGDPIDGWTLAFSFAAGQSITQLWNGSFTQSGSAVTVTNAAHNAPVATNGSVSFGFNGSWTGSNPAPTTFTLNGTACAVTP